MGLSAQPPRGATLPGVLPPVLDDSSPSSDLVCATLSTPAYRRASCEDRCGIFPPAASGSGAVTRKHLDLAVRAHAIGVALPPDAAITGWAAAYLLGVTDLDGTAWTREGERALDISVVRTADRCRIRRPGADDGASSSV